MHTRENIGDFRCQLFTNIHQHDRIKSRDQRCARGVKGGRSSQAAFIIKFIGYLIRLPYEVAIYY